MEYIGTVINTSIGGLVLYNLYKIKVILDSIVPLTSVLNRLTTDMESFLSNPDADIPSSWQRLFMLLSSTEMSNFTATHMRECIDTFNTNNGRTLVSLAFQVASRNYTTTMYNLLKTDIMNSYTNTFEIVQSYPKIFYIWLIQSYYRFYFNLCQIIAYMFFN
jgi:hypothetical protein